MSEIIPIFAIIKLITISVIAIIVIAKILTVYER